MGNGWTWFSEKCRVSRCQVTEFNAQQHRTRRQGGLTVIWLGLGMEGMAEDAGGENSKVVVSVSLNDHWLGRKAKTDRRRLMDSKNQEGWRDSRS